MSATVVAEPNATPETRPEERRRSTRFPLLQRCLVRTKGQTVEDWRGITYNISKHGIGVALPFPFPVGTIFNVEAWGRKRLPILQAKVVRCSAVEFMWFHGCELLTPLPDSELHTWLK